MIQDKLLNITVLLFKRSKKGGLNQSILFVYKKNNLIKEVYNIDL